MNLNTGGWALRVLTPLLRIIRSSPNATVPVVVISEPVNSETAALVNADIALVAKGTGATLAQVPDGTAANGAKRGAGAVDWQKLRNTGSRVASGAYATISGGSYNEASGSNSTVAGGENSIASSSYSFIGGGQGNTASSSYSSVGGGQSNIASTGTHATVCGGDSNTASGQYSLVGGGQSNIASFTGASVLSGRLNTASGTYSSIASGRSNATSGSYSSISGGRNNTASGEYSFISGGFYGTTRLITGYHVFPACSSPFSANQGVTQSALLLLGRETTDATAIVLASDANAAATTNQVTLPNNSAYYFRGSVIAGVTGAGDSKSWTFEGAIKRGASAGTTAIVGTVILNTIAQNAGASAWSIAITANTTLGCIAVTVTGAAATTIRWVAKLETTEMTY